MTIQEQIRMKLQFYGYDQLKRIDLTPLIRELGLILQYLPENKTVLKFAISKDRMLKDTAAFFSDSSLALHRVNYAPQEDIQKVAQSATSLDNLLEQINSIIVPSNPLEIPHVYVPGHTMEGETQKPLLLVPDENYLKKSPVIFSSIQLGNNITKISTATYIHEITHTQLESIKGSVRDYYNKEVLSILMEKIAIYKQDKDAYIISDRMRLRHLFECLVMLNYSKTHSIPQQEIIERETYIISILKAYKLYDLYVGSNENTKKEILANIQRIFDGELVLEDFLTNYGITNSTSLNAEIVKKHLK